MAETTISASVKPIPMPMPSAIDSQTLFLLANASARPRIMQFTTINGMNMPRALCNSCANAFIIRSTTVTKVAIITM